jgi:hypothetical protein
MLAAALDTQTKFLKSHILEEYHDDVWTELNPDAIFAFFWGRVAFAIMIYGLRSYRYILIVLKYIHI